MQETWGRKDLLKALQHQTSLSSLDSMTAMKEVIDLLKKALIEEGKVKINSFGTFQVYDQKARIGRNPKTGEKKVIPARKVIRFKKSPLLDQKINGKE